MMPEFSRPERVDTIGTVPRTVTLEAGEPERRALALRFDLVAIDRLTAQFALRCAGEAILAEGRVEASVVQACSVTGDPIATNVHEPVALRFVEETGAPAEGEIELDADEIDTLPIERGAIDLGEAAAETLALALDPFPRGPAAAEALKAAGVIDEDEVRPFNAFAALGGKLEG